MTRYQVLVIGGGPGGYETAIRLNQYGLECALIESGRLGGVCLNWGCIPTKALVKSAELYREMSAASDFGLPSHDLELDYGKVFARKNAVVEQLVSGVEFLFRKRQIPVIKERAERVEPAGSGYVVTTSSGSRVETEFLVIATGSVPKNLPGIEIDEAGILSSTGLLNLESLPRTLAVIGGGVVGCEFASIMNAFGVEVRIIEYLPRILPQEDEEISKRLALALKKAGIKVVVGTGVHNAQGTAAGIRLDLANGDSVEAEKVLLSAGRAPDFNLAWSGEPPATDRGAILIDEQMRTNLPNVYAIGDVTAKLPLAHTASKQGLLAAADIRARVQGSGGHKSKLIYTNIPRCTFTHPEVASVGLTETEAVAAYGKAAVGRFPFSANGKALALGDSFGFVKTIAHPETLALVGMHIIGPNAAELIAQGALLVSRGTTPAEAEETVFAHPTLSEAIKEAIEDLHNLSIHKV